MLQIQFCGILYKYYLVLITYDSHIYYYLPYHISTNYQYTYYYIWLFIVYLYLYMCVCVTSRCRPAHEGGY